MSGMGGAGLWRRELMDRFDQRSLRERLLLLTCALGLLALVWDGLLMAPLERQRIRSAPQVEQLRAEVAGLESGLQTLQRQAATEPDRAEAEQVAALRGEVAALDARLSSATSGLIEPQEMRRVLERVLTHAAPLTLRALHSLPPEPLLVTPPTAPPAGAAPAPAAAAAPQIYKHGLEIEWAGSYLDTLRLLQELEALPWRFFWDRIEFEVAQHPQGVVRVRLYTLGLHEGWIGV